MIPWLTIFQKKPPPVDNVIIDFVTPSGPGGQAYFTVSIVDGNGEVHTARKYLTSKDKPWLAHLFFNAQRWILGRGSRV